jgi:hypothetical protein
MGAAAPGLVTQKDLVAIGPTQVQISFHFSMKTLSTAHHPPCECQFVLVGPFRALAKRLTELPCLETKRQPLQPDVLKTESRVLGFNVLQLARSVCRMRSALCSGIGQEVACLREACD